MPAPATAPTAADHTPSPTADTFDLEAEIKRLREALERVREVRDHYASPTTFPADGLAPVASVVSRLDAALADGGPS